MYQGVVSYKPLALAPLAREIFDRLKQAQLPLSCIFGGAQRDTDYNARYQTERVIKDYDIRIWLPQDNYTSHEETTLTRLEEQFGERVITPAGGTPHLRHIFNFHGAELDISLRPIPAEIDAVTESVAINRAGDSDMGLCSVALDPELRGWCRPEYLQDLHNKTLTAFPIDNAERKRIYTARMVAKFPDHTLINL